jgi:DNA repair protein RecO (recombination protein O)
MKWEDEGILLSARKYGESNAIIEVLTTNHGRHAGLVRHAYSGKQNNLLEPGMQLDLVWTARLNEHLGIFLIDKVKSRTATLIQSKDRLLGFNSLVSLLLISLPEREPFERLYKATINLVDSMETDIIWLPDYVRWELLLLAELGFGLDLSACAVTGTNLNLVYVSPKSGRAVSSCAGREWRSKLLHLPEFLTLPSNVTESTSESIHEGVTLTGYFLEKWVMASLSKYSLPEARKRFFISLIC